MEPRFLIDTNILIHVFSQELLEQQAGKMNDIFQYSFNISVINKIQFLGWKEASLKEQQQARDFLPHSNVLVLDDPFIDRTIQLRRDEKPNYQMLL